ncbi:hypothetical protein AXR72_25740 [Salmonella enterica subsp. enterica]|nr:hypothetical protein [Salmonella enterica subsp. enterica]
MAIKESQINSTSNINTSNSKVKSDNGFAIICSNLNNENASTIASYKAITFDAVPAIKVSRSADVTSYPVQDGNDVSDNVRIKNNKLMLSGIITETPLALRGDMLSSAGVNGNRCSQAIAYLDEIMNARQPIIVSTEHKTFDNMILTGIDYEYKTESALQFDLQFEQIRLVSYATTNAIAVKTASPKSTGGQVKSQVPTNAGTASTTKDTLPTYDGEVK